MALLSVPRGLTALEIKQIDNAYVYVGIIPFLNLYLSDGCHFMQDLLKDHEILMDYTQVNCNLNTLPQLVGTV